MNAGSSGRARHRQESGQPARQAYVGRGSAVPVRGRSRRSFGRHSDRGVVPLTGHEAGAVIGGADPRKTASGQSRRSGAEPERPHPVFSRRSGESDSPTAIDAHPHRTASDHHTGAAVVTTFMLGGNSVGVWLSPATHASIMSAHSCSMWRRCSAYSALL